MINKDLKYVIYLFCNHEFLYTKILKMTIDYCPLFQSVTIFKLICNTVSKAPQFFF